MLDILYINGTIDHWDSDEFTDYEYMKDVFVIIKDKQWVGIYNMSQISTIRYYGEE